MDTRQIVARFEAERQALAMMDHPNIAKVFDGGATEAGRPYFVMELVRGIKITDYCDQNNFPTEERLELFMQVCKAIQHAHQKGIIHRDIKPSNILVTLHDGVPVPKVIDFGIAKAIEQRLTDKTLLTALEQFIGTPAYMSPEQAGMSELDIDTRSDVYSLGVLLYELLTSKLPFEQKDLAKAGVDEIRRIIREKEPVKPSTKLSNLDATDRTTVARRRQVEGPKLIHLIQGDLDWIVMKCLEKDRTRRYETAIGLAREVERFLNDEPVTACPPSRVYRFQKLVRRNKLAFGAASAVMVALLLGISISTWMFLRERTARRQATESNDQAEAVMDFLQNRILAATRPEGEEGGLGHDVTIRRAIAAAEPQISILFSNQPLAEARIRGTLGLTFMHLSEFSNAIPQFRRALDIGERRLGTNDADTLTWMNDLGAALDHAGRWTEAIPMLETALQRTKSVAGTTDDVYLEIMNNLSEAYASADRLQDALAMTQEVAKNYERKYGPFHRGSLTALGNLATAFMNAGQLSNAILASERTFTNCVAGLGPTHPQTMISMQNLADVYREAGRFGDALRLHTNNLEWCYAKLGTNHEGTLKVLNNIGLDYLRSGHADEAIPWFQKAVSGHTAAFGTNHPITLTMMSNLGGAYADSGHSDEAISLIEKVIEVQRTVYHVEDAATLNNLALRYLCKGWVSEALAAYTHAVEVAFTQLGPTHPNTCIVMQGQAGALLEAGRLDEAIALDSKVMGLQKSNLGPEHVDTLLTTLALANDYLRTNGFAEAARLLTNVLAVQGRQPDSPLGHRVQTLSLLAKCALGNRDYVVAKDYAQQGLGLPKAQPSNDWRFLELRNLLGASLAGLNDDAAEAHLRESCCGLTNELDNVSFLRRRVFEESFSRLIGFYSSHFRPEEARAWTATREEVEARLARRFAPRVK
jgi:tetratricopeptide (TPR) repeat protein